MPRLLTAIAAAAVLGCVAGPAGATTNIGVAPLRWVSPTPKIGATVNVTVGKPVSIAFAAADPVPLGVVHVSAVSIPAGASFTSADGNPGTATFTWTPTADQVGSFKLFVNAKDNLPVAVQAPQTLVFVNVRPAPPEVGTTQQLSSGETTTWAFVSKTTVARAAPSGGAHAVGRVTYWTPENYHNLVDVLQQQYTRSGWWAQVRLSSLPNSRLGWVPRARLAPYHQVTTHVYVNRTTLTLTLTKGGITVFKTRVGVGRSYWPTPRGEFYIREKITGFRNPMYGPIAFGTSARSSVLTDWPGGGFIGIHGTNEPQIIPGHVSHGCIRVKNAQILKLARLLPLGTPVTIS